MVFFENIYWLINCLPAFESLYTIYPLRWTWKRPCARRNMEFGYDEETTHEGIFILKIHCSTFFVFHSGKRVRIELLSKCAHWWYPLLLTRNLSLIVGDIADSYFKSSRRSKDIDSLSHSASYNDPHALRNVLFKSSLLVILGFHSLLRSSLIFADTWFFIQTITSMFSNPKTQVVLCHF